MTTCQVSSKPKRADEKGGTVQQDAADGSSFVRGLSPTSNGPLSAFYSAAPVLSLGKPIQRKLTIGQPDDEYEQEADRVADQVMRTPTWPLSQGPSGGDETIEGAPVQTKPLADQITPLVQRQTEEEEEEPIQGKSVESTLFQRQPEEEEEEEEVQTKLINGSQVQRQEDEEEEEPIQAKFHSMQVPIIQRQEVPEEEEEEEPIQAKPLSGRLSRASTGVQSQIRSLRGGGQPIPKSSRAFFESRFGRGFGDVRVHTDASAADTAKSINAKAFTTGRDVVFGPGQYSPETPPGKRLLAHELTHVLQQDQEKNNVIHRWRWGRGSVPGEPNFRPVIRSHRPRVRSAMRILRRIVRSRRCRNYFKDNCPGGSAATLRRLYRRMRIWGLHERGSLGGNSGDNVSYEEPYIYRIGRYSIAATLLHEMMHMCGIGTSAADERTCERAVERCRAYTPFIESVSPRAGRVGTIVRITGYGFGLSQGSTDRVRFNGVNAGRAITWQYTHGVGSEIRIRVPARARTGSIVVINNNVRSNRWRFRVRR